MANRLFNAEMRVADRLNNLSDDEVSTLDKNMAIDFEEHFAFQNQQAQAHVSGKLTTDEASYIYAALGESYSDGNGGWKAGVPTARKIVVTQVMSELLTASVGRLPRR